MSDYDFSGLGSRSFQQLVQAIALKEVGAGVVVYGDGPDGGRDASFKGRMNYPSTTEPWDGYLVMQVKFRQKPADEPRKDADWLCEQLREELNVFLDESAKRTLPEYYIVVVNAQLSAVPQVGGDSRVRALLEDYGKRLGLKGWDVWDGWKVGRFLDAHRDIASTYGGYTATGDVLAKMQAQLGDAQPAFEGVITDYLQGELVADQYARLREAGSAAERRTPLVRVFVDLPTTAVPESEALDIDDLPDNEQEGDAGFVKMVASAGQLRMDRKSILDRRAQTGREQGPASPEDGRLVLIGGPGQGKSTLGQFVCQLYRAAILKDRPRHTLSEDALRR